MTWTKGPTSHYLCLAIIPQNWDATGHMKKGQKYHKKWPEGPYPNTCAPDIVEALANRAG